MRADERLREAIHRPDRHCERKRSNPSRRAKKEWIASSLSLLAMTETYIRHLAA
jgi:hypothetical protein